MSMSDELDLERRRLCPDGACIGVIGPNGRCGMCGRAAEPGGDTADTEAGSEAEAETESRTETESETDPEGGFDEGRRLCPDGACIGVIGDDGRCKVCGTRAGS